MVDDAYMLEILESAAPSPPSADVALEELRPRIRRARRRRAAMRGSAALVVLVVLGGVASQTTSSGTSRDLRVGGTDSTAVIESTTTSVAPATTVARSGAEDTTPPGAPGAATPDGAAAQQPAESASSARIGGAPHVGDASSNGVAVGPASSPAATNRAPGGRSSTANSGAGAAAGGGTAPGAPHVTTFGSQAGTVEVAYTDTSMKVESVSPLPGWSVGTTEAGDAAIQVTFESESGEEAAVDLEVHLDGGVPVVGAADETVDEAVEGAGDVPDVVAGS